MKQFLHYLQGRNFSVVMDHAPLQWLSSQKMEGLLARWALAIQEYNFTIMYRKGLENGNADALSQKDYNDVDHTVAATTQLSMLTDQLHQQQLNDPVICHINEVLCDGHSHPPRDTRWCQYPLSCYRQLWSPLCLNDGIVCQKFLC